MALIKNANPKGDIKDSSYYRLCGNERIANILQKSQSTVISNGTELEHEIKKECPYTVYETQWTNISPKTGNIIKSRFKIKGSTPTLSTIFEKFNNGENCYFPKIKISKEELKSHGVTLSSKKNIELDGVWITNGHIYITEIKDGDNFDTKKSDGEIKMFKMLEKLFKNYPYTINMIPWNLKNIDNHSVKSDEGGEYITTGKLFSDKVGLDYNTICENRKKDRTENVKWLIEEMRKVVQEYDETHN
tara:strand:+ start:83 stop:820 length:738 start_codon:yes stop_codon:yes gene_type:complete